MKEEDCKLKESSFSTDIIAVAEIISESVDRRG